jgi:hypothetical protein
MLEERCNGLIPLGVTLLISPMQVCMLLSQVRIENILEIQVNPALIVYDGYL